MIYFVNFGQLLARERKGERSDITLSYGISLDAVVLGLSEQAWLWIRSSKLWRMLHPFGHGQVYRFMSANLYAWM